MSDELKGGATVREFRIVRIESSWVYSVVRIFRRTPHAGKSDYHSGTT
jgi:hypothetical protein